MKTQLIRIVLIVFIIIALIFSAVIGLALLAGSFTEQWLLPVIGINLVFVFVASFIVIAIGADKHFFMTRDQLEKEIEAFNNQRMTYEKATIEMQRKQLEYNYKKTALAQLAKQGKVEFKDT